MRATTENAQKLIRDLISTCLIDFPSELKVEPRELSAEAVYWILQGHADDYRKICGSNGAHIKALTFIIGELGEAPGEEYKTWLKESVVGEKRPMPEIQPRDDYDPRDARDLLFRVLDACLGGTSSFAVNVKADGSRIAVPPFSLLYTFEISVRSEDDRVKLAEPYEGDFENRTLVESLEAIWRAYAAKSGVAFQIELLPP